PAPRGPDGGGGAAGAGRRGHRAGGGGGCGAVPARARPGRGDDRDGRRDRLPAGPPAGQRRPLVRLAQADGAGWGGAGAARAGRPAPRGPPARGGARLSDGPRATRGPLLATLAGPAVLLAVLLALFGRVLLQGDSVLLSRPRWDMLLQYLPWRVFG